MSIDWLSPDLSLPDIIPEHILKMSIDWLSPELWSSDTIPKHVLRIYQTKQTSALASGGASASAASCGASASESSKESYEEESEEEMERNFYKLVNRIIYSYRESDIMVLIDRISNKSLNKRDEYGDTALIWACRKENESLALKLLDRSDINVNQVNKYENTALTWASKNKMDNVVRCILSKT